MSGYNQILGFGFAAILVIALMPLGLGLELKITGTSNHTFNLDDSYLIQDNDFNVTNASSAQPDVLLNSINQGVNPSNLNNLDFSAGTNEINFTEDILAFELNMIYLIRDGYSCTADSDCDSNNCRTDHNLSNGDFCAKDSTSCVHKKSSDTTATQYDDGDKDGAYRCDASTWKIDDDYPCTLDLDCDSGYCRTDYDFANGNFCAKDDESCVHLNPGDTEATQYDDEEIGNTYYRCKLGTWKLRNGYSCILDSECYSDVGYCRSDYNIANGDFCAKDSTSCVHKKFFDTRATQYDDGDKFLGHKCKSGSWGIQDTDGDGVEDSSDKCPDTPSGCNIGLDDDDIDTITGCPNKPISSYKIKDDVTGSCIGSSIPVDPEKSTCLEQKIADDLNISLSLKKGILGYSANNPDECNLEDGTFGWHDIIDSRYYCEFAIADTLPVDTYNLTANYTINGLVYNDVFKTGFTVASQCQPDTICSHGGHMLTDDSLTGGTLTFDRPTAIEGAAYVTCNGATGTISDVSQYISKCSDSAASISVNPGLLAWVYDPSSPIFHLGYSDNLFQGGTFEPIPLFTRDAIFNSKEGFLWTSDLKWSRGAATNDVDNFYTFSLAGDYILYLDNIDNFCDAPDYVCPNNPHLVKGPLCDVGTLETRGFMPVNNYSIKIINPVANLSLNPPTDTYYVSDPYNPSIKKTYTWSIRNTGIGNISITDIDITGPIEIGCSSTPSSDIDISEGAELSIDTDFTLPCEYGVTDYLMTLSFYVDDAYGLTCAIGSTETVTTQIIQGNTSDDSSAACACYTQRDDLWDSDMGCCDPTDCWISGDQSWICNGGISMVGAVGTEICGSISICNETKYWNGSAWTDKMPDGCLCYDSEECECGSCIAGICIVPMTPNISFTLKSISGELGSNINGVIIIKSNLPTGDSIKLSIHTSPEKVLHWSAFENSENEIVVDLNAYEEKSVPIEIFAGELGTYNIKIIANSLLLPALYAEDNLDIHVVEPEGEINSRSPGLKWFSIFLILLAAIFIYKKKSI